MQLAIGMSLIARVAAAMGEVAPLALADHSWDNVGVLVENPSPNQSGVVVLTIDLTPQVLEECIRQRAEVILAYHPPIFTGMKRLVLSNPKERIVLHAIREGISIYSPHTSLDACEKGINDWLISVTGAVKNVTPITPTAVDSISKRKMHCSTKEAFISTGMGRVADFVTPEALDALVEKIKHGLSIPTVRVSVPPGWERCHPVRSIAVCAGSGSSVFRNLRRQVDVLLSGEMGHHDVLAANAAGQAVILCEHTNTERGYLRQVLQANLQVSLGTDASVLVSTCDVDPLTVW